MADPGVVVPILVAIPSAVVVTFRWFRHRERMAQVTPPDRDRAALQREAHLDERLDRLEHAVQAIAVEVERIGEGQRFVTRLLGERAPLRPELAQPRERAAERPNTPH